MTRLLGLLSVLVSAVALGKATGDWRLGGVIGAIATVLAAVGPRWEVDRGRRLLTAAMGAGAGYIVVTVLYERHAGALEEGWTRFAAAATLAAAARFLLIGSAGRLVTIALIFTSLLASGETHVAGYGVLVAVFVLTSLWAPVLHDERKMFDERTPARRLVAGVAVTMLGAAAMVGATVGAARAYAWLSNRERSSTLTWSPRVGFSDQIDLGALDGLIDSDAVVLRVRGPRVDYLRGAVLDAYAGGRWYRSDEAEREAQTNLVGADVAPDNSVKITAVSETTDRFFLPLDARWVTASPPDVLVDGLGAVKRTSKIGEVATRFVVGPRDRAAPDDPGPTDLRIPRSIRPRIEALVATWVAGAETPGEKVDAIERRFKADFHYARTFARVTGPDPALDFLFGNRSGHCEYFATGMALAARAVGVPARFVAGYRVGEQSPFGYYVVRERNAHAWVEVWLPGRGWTTRDATPDAELPQNREHRSGYLASLTDGVRVGYDDAVEWLQSRTLEQTAIAWLVGFAILLWIVARGVRRRGASVSAARHDEVALPCFEVLLSTLSRDGLVHDGREPIERMALRAADREAARLLERYAALRYGGLGDAGQLADDVASYARRRRGSGADDGGGARAG